MKYAIKFTLDTDGFTNWDDAQKVLDFFHANKDAWKRKKPSNVWILTRVMRKYAAFFRLQLSNFMNFEIHAHIITAI